MKMKEFGPPGGGRASLAPPLGSANVIGNKYYVTWQLFKPVATLIETRARVPIDLTFDVYDNSIKNFYLNELIKQNSTEAVIVMTFSTRTALILGVTCSNYLDFCYPEAVHHCLTVQIYPTLKAPLNT